MRAILLWAAFMSLLHFWRGEVAAFPVQCVAAAVAAGTSDAITVPDLPCTRTNTLLVLMASAANQTDTPTIQAENGAALPIVKDMGRALLPSDIAGAGFRAILTSNGQQWWLRNPEHGAASLSGTSYSPFDAGYYQFTRDFWSHWWDSSKGRPRIRPTRRSGYIRDLAPTPTFWQMAQAGNVLYWQWKPSRDAQWQVRIPPTVLPHGAWRTNRLAHEEISFECPQTTPSRPRGTKCQILATWYKSNA
jgi:hypothetical protein